MGAKDIVQHQFTSEQSRTEAAENGRKGGIASGEARRRNRTLREIAEMLSEKKIPIKDAEGNAELVTYDVAMIHGQFQKAIQQKDTKATKFLATLLGEFVEKHEVEAKGVIMLPKDEIEGIGELARK